MIRFLAVAFALGLSWPAFAETALPRVLVALYDNREESSARTTQIHRFLEMPANHLGYDVHYYPIEGSLPSLGNDVAGVLLWFNNGTEVPDAKVYLSWLMKAQAAGKKIIVIENGGIGDKWRKDVQVVEQWNQVLRGIGLYDDNNWQSLTYQARIAERDHAMVGFERALPPVLPGFADTHTVLSRGTSHLRLMMDKGEGELSYDLIVTGEGGYVAEDYAIFHVVDREESKISQWIINPFLFLKQALAVDLNPIPDVTTLDGRRIFYSHIDGDGWNNITEIRAYNQNKMISAEVIENEILKPYTDFAFTVGLITSDVGCYAAPDSERVARSIFALPNVEPASHTHSHPLFWRFFAGYVPAKEKPYLDRYPSPPRHDLFSAIRQDAGSSEAWEKAKDEAPMDAEPIKLGKNDQSEANALKYDYHTPRSYACTPFNLDDEVAGSVATVARLAPGKTVKLLQWSGDTSPFAGALAATRKAGLLNINGGDTRLDSEYPSYSFVAPIGFNLGEERQIYSSNSNENTYTNLWTGRFFGFRYLQRTIENTERPRRVTPVNLYFHMYSGEKEASLTALKENLEFLRKQSLIPIETSRYAAIANGFYTAEIVPQGKDVWEIRHRGALSTVRFDEAGGRVVNLDVSKGVLGYRVVEERLYVALDPAVAIAVVALGETGSDHTYLIESSWNLEQLRKTGEQAVSFVAAGYGNGRMRWQMSEPGTYNVSAEKSGALVFKQTLTTETDAVLAFDVAALSSGDPLTITITREDSNV